jgi:hypothetical protein
MPGLMQTCTSLGRVHGEGCSSLLHTGHNGNEHSCLLSPGRCLLGEGAGERPPAGQGAGEPQRTGAAAPPFSPASAAAHCRAALGWIWSRASSRSRDTSSYCGEGVGGEAVWSGASRTCQQRASSWAAAGHAVLAQYLRCGCTCNPMRCRPPHAAGMLVLWSVSPGPGGPASPAAVPPPAAAAAPPPGTAQPEAADRDHVRHTNRGTRAAHSHQEQPGNSAMPIC